MSQFGILLNCYIVAFTSYSLGALSPTDPDQRVCDQNWRVIFAMPAVIAIVHITLFLFVFKEEPVAFCISEGRNAEARALLKKVYKSTDVEDFDGVIDDHLEHLAKHTTKDVSTISFKDTVCRTKYPKATWVFALLNTFMQQTGINAVNVYAARLLVSMEEATVGNFPVSPLARMGLVKILGAVLATPR